MFRHVTGKIGNMRKSVEWTVCPVSNNETDERTIQSEKRIAKVNLTTETVVLSDGKGGHQGFMKLSNAFGAKEYPCPEEILTQLRNLDEDHGEQPEVVTILSEKPVPIVQARKE